MKLKTSAFSRLGGVLLCVWLTAGAVLGQWVQQSAGTYDYNDNTNWNGFTINGVFDATSTISGAQVLTFGADTALSPTGSNSLYFSYPASTTLSTITFQSDSATTRTLTLGGNIVSTASGATAGRQVIFGPTLTLDTNGANRSITFAGTNKATFSAKITGTGGIISDGNSAVNYANTANDYTGNFSGYYGETVIYSLADAGQASSLGAGSSVSLVSAQLRYLGSGNSTSNRTINTTGTGFTLYNTGTGNLTLTGAVNVTNSAAVTKMIMWPVSGNLTFSGTITEYGTNTAASLLKLGSGTATLTATNSNFKGKTDINVGTLEVTSVADVGVVSSIGAASTATNGVITVGSAGNSATLKYIGSSDSTSNRVVNIGGADATINASGAGKVKFTSDMTATNAQSNKLTLRGTSTAGNEIAGAIVDNSVANKTSLQKSDSGTWILAGANTYTGATTASGGILYVNGSIATSSAVLVNSGATLAGDGDIYGAVSLSGSGTTLAAGATAGAAGSLYTGSLTLGAGSVLNFDLGSLSDMVLVDGLLTLSGAMTLNVNGLAGFGANSYTLFDYGTFSGSLSSITISSVPGGYTYALEDTGSAVLLNVIPEPGTYGLVMLSGFMALIATFRRRSTISS